MLCKVTTFQRHFCTILFSVVCRVSVLFSNGKLCFHSLTLFIYLSACKIICLHLCNLIAMLSFSYPALTLLSSHEQMVCKNLLQTVLPARLKIENL